MVAAVREVVEAIFSEEMNPRDNFGIESCEQAKIVKYPKGSPASYNNHNYNAKPVTTPEHQRITDYSTVI
jgi:hypothetical protein